MTAEVRDDRACVAKTHRLMCECGHAVTSHRRDTHWSCRRCWCKCYAGDDVPCECTWAAHVAASPVLTEKF